MDMKKADKIMNIMNFTTRSVNTSETENLDHYFRYFHVYVLPVIILFGLLGNLLSIVVCLSPRLRRIPSSYYLTALAVYDSLCLFLYFLLWIELFGASPNDTSAGCRIIGYLLNITTCLSAWSVTAFTIERFIVVYYPLHRAAICTPRKAKIVLLAQLPYPLLINLPYFFIMSVESGSCDIIPKYNIVNNVLGILDATMSCIIPLGTICVMNVLIVKQLIKTQNEARLLKAESNTSASKDKGVTRMLIIVSSCFTVLNLPSYALRVKVLVLIILDKKKEWSQADAAMEHIFYILYTLNFALDFLLYNISSKNFRKIAYELFIGTVRTRCQTTTGVLTSSRHTMTTSIGTQASSGRKRHKNNRLLIEEHAL